MVEDLEIFQEKLRAVRDRFRAALPGKIAALKTAWQKLGAGPGGFDALAAAELRQIAHNLAGFPIGVAHPEMNRQAMLLEALVHSLLESASGDAFTGETSAAPRKDGSTLADYLLEVKQLILSLEQSAAKPISTTFEAVREIRERDTRSLYLVDDDHELASALADQLDHFGYRTTVFADPPAMEKTLAEGPPPAAILMDIVFCEQTTAGLESAHRIKDLNIPLIFLSARDDLDARLEAIRAGGQAYMTKPVYITSLVDRLDELPGVVSEDPLRILLVEDDQILSAYYALILEQAGLTTSILSEPATIFERLAGFRPDLIVMDQYLSAGFLGSDLARAIQQHEQFFDIPAVFLSTEKSIDIHFNVLAAGGDIFLTKPLRPDHLVAVVIAKAERARKLHGLAIRDSLTRLLNHAAAKEELAGTVAQARRLEKTISVAMLDLDYFKEVNDRHGHMSGDRVLLALARILKQRLRQSDVVARYGGEEFLVILPYTPGSAATEVMNEIRKHFESVQMSGKEGLKFYSSFSCGVADLDDAPDAPALINAADQALYAAKSAGRNQVVLYDPARHAGDGSSAARDERHRGAGRGRSRSAAHAGTESGNADPGSAAGEPADLERLKDEFISMVNHELRTPLTGIAGALGLLDGGAAGELPQRARELVHVATIHSERLSRLIHDLLDMERIESGRIRYRFESADLAHLVRESVHEAQNQGRAGNIEVELLECPAELTLSRIDPVQMRRLLDNLLHNAVRFSPEYERVAVRLTHDSEQGLVRFAVTDRGPGIPPAFRNRVFSKFAQADSSAARERGGAGLSLSMCRSIVERHGGTIGFESELRQATTFYFELEDPA